MNKNKYLFCYSKRMQSFLISRGFEYICVGINERTNTRFWLFEKTEQVTDSLDEYDRVKHGLV